jgi:hypothetical protein
MKFYQLVSEILMHQKNNLIVIFPGRFQPFHIGHKKFFDMVKKQFPGADFFIATSDINTKDAAKDPSRYPFNFNEKKQIMLAAGIPEQEIKLVKQPYKPIEILKDYDPNITKVIYVVGEKDMKEDPRFSFGMTKKGTPTYFQPFKSLNEMDPFKEEGGHGYIYSPGTITFTVNNKAITSATELRNIYKAANGQQRKEIITNVIGKFDPVIYNLFNTKLG